MAYESPVLISIRDFLAGGMPHGRASRSHSDAACRIDEPQFTLKQFRLLSLNEIYEKDVMVTWRKTVKIKNLGKSVFVSL